MSVTDDPAQGIPHGLRGYRRPYACRCAVCKREYSAYMKQWREDRKEREREDELSRKREAKKRDKDGNVIITTAKQRAAWAAKRTESRDSDGGSMESAVITECAELERAKERPTLYRQALTLAKILDSPKLSGMHVQTSKQLTSILAELHGDTAKATATGKRKSGGRLATVGALTKVKRAQ